MGIFMEVSLWNPTMWGFPVLSWLKPWNTAVIGTRKHSYWNYVQQLSYLGEGATLYIMGFHEV